MYPKKWMPITAATLAYLLCLFQWLLAYKSVWYANLPEATVYFHNQKGMPGYYMKYLYFFAILAFIGVSVSIVFLIKVKSSRWLKGTICTIVTLSLYMTWVFSVDMKGHYNQGIMTLNLALYITALFLYLYPVHKSTMN